MGKKIIIDGMHADEIRVGIEENGKLTNFLIDSQNKQITMGNVYLGKILRIEWSINGAFVDFGAGKNGLMRLSEVCKAIFIDKGKIKKIEDILNIADKKSELSNVSMIQHYLHKNKSNVTKNLVSKNIIIQIDKEARDEKGANLSGAISILGRYCVLLPNENSTSGVSKKIRGESERKRLKNAIQSISIPDTVGFIIRSASKNISDNDIKHDYQYLQKTWSKILKIAQKEENNLIYEEANLIERCIRDYCDTTVEEIIVAGDEIYKRIKSSMKITLQETHPTLTLDNDQNIFDKYNLTKEIDSLYKEEVLLECGAKIIIQQTAAFISIDVNSHKAKTRQGNTQFNVNIEAAKEIGRQIILRNIAGIIIIDFIDMHLQKYNATIKTTIEEAMSNDNRKINICDINQLGVMCISRERIGSSVMEISMENCSKCDATGKIFQINTRANQLIREIAKQSVDNAENNSEDIVVVTDDTIARHILNYKKDNICKLEKTYAKKIFFQNKIEKQDQLIPVKSKKIPIIESEMKQPIIYNMSKKIYSILLKCFRKII